MPTPSAGESEWTHVVSRRRHKHLSSNHHDNESQSSSLAPRTTTLRTVASITEEYTKIYSHFRDSACYIALRHIISGHSGTAKQVDRAICLGVGTFDPADGAWEAKRRTFIQTLAFLAIVEEIGTLPFPPPSSLERCKFVAEAYKTTEKVKGEKLRCIFQEPIFTVSDKEFITSLGHDVVESPVACEMVTSTTFLYAIHLYRPIYCLALKLHLPSIFVGTGWDVWERYMLFT